MQEDGFEHAAQAARIESAKRESKLRAQLAQEAKVGWHPVLADAARLGS